MTYPFASLSSGLLARKGAAQPAMTSHGGGNPLRMAIREEARPHGPLDDAFVGTPTHRPQAPLKPNGHAPLPEMPAAAAAHPAPASAVAPLPPPYPQPTPKPNDYAPRAETPAIPSAIPMPAAPLAPAHRPTAPLKANGHAPLEQALAPRPQAPLKPSGHPPAGQAPAYRPQPPVPSAAPVHGHAPGDDQAVHAIANPVLFRPQTVLARAGFVFESSPPPRPSVPRTETSPAVPPHRTAETGGGCGSSGSCNVADSVATDPARRFHVSVRLKQSHFVRLKIASAQLRKPSQDIVSEALGMFFRSLEPGVFGDCACAREG